MTCLGNRPSVAFVASEEDEEPTILRAANEGGKYCVVFDPLDGSSNLDVCVSVGTIFSILRQRPDDPRRGRDALPARHAAGGGRLHSVRLVDGVRADHRQRRRHVRARSGDRIVRAREERDAHPGVGQDLLGQRGLPAHVLRTGFSRYLDWAHANGYSSRYIGSMVSDVHRILLKGGVFLYPPTKKNPEGKLRLMYEANPMAMIVEQAGGTAVAPVAADPVPARILDVNPTSIHQRTSVVLGSPREVEHVVRHLQSSV